MTTRDALDRARERAGVDIASTTWQDTPTGEVETWYLVLVDGQPRASFDTQRTAEHFADELAMQLIEDSAIGAAL